MNTRTLIITFVWMIMSNIGICAQEHWDAQERIELNKGVFPKNFSKAIDIIQYDLLGIERGKSHVKVIDNNTLYINLSFSLKNSVQQGDWRIAVKPDFYLRSIGRHILLLLIEMSSINMYSVLLPLS